MIFFFFSNLQEPSILKFSEDQLAQLLSAFWAQANFPDNLPSNIEALAHSYCLTLLSLRLKVRILVFILLLACFSFQPIHTAFFFSLLCLAKADIG